MLHALCKVIGDKATPIIEKGKIIGLKDGDGGSVSLEPGGQLELSGAPLSNLHQTCAETGRHLRHMRAVSSALGVGMLGIGFQPKWRREDISWMPKGRYQIMQNHMPKVGTMGLDMMLRSCTVQVNLDYADEEDMRRKFRASLALQPIATALFANSPFKDGKPSGWLSGRAHVWTDTDNARCGVPSCVFDSHFGYEQWIDYILDVPMYFLHRGEDYVDVAGKSFRDYLAGTLAGFEGEPPQMADFEDHITTAFPEVRLKQYLEMRGADSGSWANICALPAYWVGLLYCDDALAEAEDLVRDIGADDIMEARLSVAKDGLRGKLGSYDVATLAKKTIDIASKGLRARGIFDGGGGDESGFLQPLRKVIATQKTPAEVMLDLYHSDWAEDIDQVFTSNQY
jgi:glutamate--cysteine ligase